MAEPTLYVVATPIGNLRDITLRALDTLKAVDAIAAEDTRVSRKLLAHFGIQAEVISAHEHNERAAAQRLVELLSQGKSVALISDAGTPAISDPGAIAVAQVRAAGFRVVSIPGASAITTAIAAAGLPSAAFCFHGFLPGRKGEREKMLDALKPRCGLQVFYEAPHRIVECVASLAAIFGGDRRVGIARELTKLFEQVHVCRLDEALAWLEQNENHRRGEFVLLVEGSRAAPDARAESDSQRVLEILLQELPLKQAVGLAAEITGTKKNALYEKALKLKKESRNEKK
ncbi:MAG TPA: 16S rRNA (cytidine(1402)-2'-O)-methyltransferase [Burkholderiales bacterium]|nr:16S rRNA (cytidine(1402)-2'-O)-methyltransferase [Burkholderiales bacterium]